MIKKHCKHYFTEKGISIVQYPEWIKKGSNCDELGLHILARIFKVHISVMHEDYV